MNITELAIQLKEKAEIKASKLVVLMRVIPDALQSFSLEDTPKEYRSAEGVKSFVGLPYLWRRCVDLPLSQLNKQTYGAVANFFTLIKRYDSIIDDNENVSKKSLYMDEKAREHLIKGILHLRRSGLSELKINEFLREFYEFREKEWELYQKYKKIPTKEMTFEQVASYKYETCSLNNDLAADLIALYHPHVQDQAKEKAKSIFAMGMMAAQVYDDQKDFYEDYQNDVPNYLNAALSLYPDEREKVMQLCANRTVILGNELIALAPKSFALCTAEFEKYTKIENPAIKDLVINQYYKRFKYKEIKINSQHPQSSKK